MLSSLWILASIILILILASAFFSSAETALTAASDARMRQLASKGNERALIVEALRADREGLIGSILIGNNAVNVLGSALATSVAISLFGEGGEPQVFADGGSEAAPPAIKMRRSAAASAASTAPYFDYDPMPERPRF